MKQVKHKVTVGGKDIPNPIPASNKNLAACREHFAHHCGICHGLDGEATAVPFANKMAPPILSLSSKDAQDYAGRSVEVDHRKWDRPIGNAGVEGIAK